MGFDMEEFMKDLANAAKKAESGSEEEFEEFAQNFFSGLKNTQESQPKNIGGLGVNCHSKGTLKFKEGSVTIPMEMTIKVAPLPKDKRIAKSILTVMAYNLLRGMTMGDVLKMDDIPKVLFRFGPTSWTIEKKQSGSK